MEENEKRTHHSVGGAAPFTVTQTISVGQTISAPRNGKHDQTDLRSPAWKMYPVLPCGQLLMGNDGQVAHFSAFVPSKSASQLIYGVMTWMFYAASKPFLVSIDQGTRPQPWLIIHTTSRADWAGLDAIYQRLLSATDREAEVIALCDEVRP